MGLTEEAAREQAAKEGYGDKVAVVKTSFKANSKVRPKADHMQQFGYARPARHLL